MYNQEVICVSVNDFLIRCKSDAVQLYFCKWVKYPLYVSEMRTNNA